MSEQLLVREQRVALPIEQTFEIYADAFNLELITPPFLRFRVVSPAPVLMGVGTLIEYRLRLHGIPVRWLTRIEEWDPPHRFVDRQVSGPYALWRHSHEFEADGDATVIRDRVRYEIGFGPLGSLALRLLVRRDVGGIFDHRRAAISELVRSREKQAITAG